MQVLLQYQSKSYYIIWQEVYYSIGRFITLSGSYYIIWRFYYIIGQLLQYRALITLSVGTHATDPNHGTHHTISMYYVIIMSSCSCSPEIRALKDVFGCECDSRNIYSVDLLQSDTFLTSIQTTVNPSEV